MVMMLWDTSEQVDRFIEGKASVDQLIQWCPKDEVEYLVQHMKSEANRHWSEDPNISFKLAEGIIALGYYYDSTAFIALGLMARGDARKFVGQIQQAWRDFQNAGRLFLAIGDRIGWARTRIGLVWICVDMKRTTIAFRDASKAHQILKKSLKTEHLVNLELNLGAAHNWIGKYQRALEYFSNVRERVPQLGARGQVYLGRLNMNTGYAYSLIGDLRKAEDYYQQALQHSLDNNQKFWIAYIELNLAFIRQVRGQFRQALILLHSALEHADNSLQATQARDQMMHCYIGLNRYLEAREMGNRVAVEYGELKADFARGRVLYYLAMTEANLENYERATNLLCEVESIFQEMDSTSWLAFVWNRRAAIALKQDKFDVALEEIHFAVSEFGSKGLQLQLADARLVAGQVYLKQNNLNQALESFIQALSVAEIHHMHDVSYHAHLFLGQIANRRGDRVTALQHFEQAVSIIDVAQKNLTITSRSEFLTDKLEALHELIRLQVDDNNILGAFELLERAKSQVFLSYLTSRESLRWVSHDKRMQALQEEMEMLREEHFLYYQIVHNEFPTTEHKLPAIPKADAEAELSIREKRIRVISEQLFLYSEDNQIRNQIDVPGVSDIQSHIGRNVVLIEYYVEGNNIWAFVIDETNITIHQLPISANELTKYLARVQSNLNRALQSGRDARVNKNLSQFLKKITRRLHETLLVPLPVHDKKRLIVVPFGILHYLPFHILFTGEKYLVQKHEIVVLPSAGLLTNNKPRRNKGALVLAHSKEGHLPQTHSEAYLVHETLGGQLRIDGEATQETLTRPPCQVLHIAAHGEFRMDQPEFAYIELGDGHLYADDLLQYDLSYELITLSACESSRANVAPGDELIGLGRACLFAGAGALLVSLWRVEDMITVTLMRSFYELLNTGASKVDALRKAQCGLLRTDPSLHPAFWGAFQLIGNPDPLLHQ